MWGKMLVDKVAAAPIKKVRLLTGTRFLTNEPVCGHRSVLLGSMKLAEYVTRTQW